MKRLDALVACCAVLLVSLHSKDMPEKIETPVSMDTLVTLVLNVGQYWLCYAVLPLTTLWLVWEVVLYIYKRKAR
jgi:hypothetical protein